MKRRQVLIGAAAVGLGAWWLKPGDRGAPHDDYFRNLQNTLQSLGTGRPLLVIDRARLRQNCERLIDNLPQGKAFRIVAKSLPSPALIREVMALTGSNRLMGYDAHVGKLPGPLPIGSLWQSWDPNRTTTLFIYGGRWMAKPESPAGLSENTLYGSSSNQMMLNGSAAQHINVDDWIFLRPTQTESVLLQFGDLLALDAGHSAQWWPHLDAGHGR